MGCSNNSSGLNTDMYPIHIVTNDDVYRKCIAYWTPFFMMYLILSLFTCLILLYVQVLYVLLTHTVLTRAAWVRNNKRFHLKIIMNTHCFLMVVLHQSFL